MALDRSYQPLVKNAGGVLIGVAQIRVGRPSIRDAVASATIGTAYTAVGQSRKVKATSNKAVYMVKPNAVQAANAGTASPTFGVTGNYTGNIDGAIIIRATATTNKGLKEEASDSATAADCLDIFDTYGTLAYTSTALDIAVPATPIQGLSFTGSFANAKIGDTWIVPVWTKAAINISQTGIISPYTLCVDSIDSIGGLKAASFAPKIDSVKKLSTGIPALVSDQIIDSTSVQVSWSGYELLNTKMALLRQMMSAAINDGAISAISVDVIMRTRGGSFIRQWIPSCSFTSLPSYAPTTDYSDVSFEMEAIKQTEFSIVTTDMGIGPISTTGTPSALDIYNGWLNDSKIYNEITLTI